MSTAELLTRMNGALLVIDPITDASETAESCEVRPMGEGDAITITDPVLIRALYDHPSATSYGEGSYTVVANA